MVINHFLLVFLWIIYCLLHSVLAATKVKLFFKKNTGKLFRYYRLAYSLFSTFTLISLLFFQYSFISPVIINSVFMKYASMIIFVIPGLVIMIISIFKYFKLLSGIRSLYLPLPPSSLKLGGIHKYVRHPLYSGTVLFIWGLFFIFPMLNNLIAVLIISVYILIGIRFEEKKLLLEFGNLYEEYISQVPMLIPRFKGSF
jgi:protein-S-isoprenylcysteine O-methyltransferase Ste14